MGALHGFFHILVAVGFGEVVERHMNIGADSPLIAHGGFWSHFEITAIDMGLEFDSVFGDFDVGKGKYLKSA